MAPCVRAVPVAVLQRLPILCEKTWTSYVDHVQIDPLPAQLNRPGVVVYRLEKMSGDHLMTPQAHFYGKVAHALVYMHDLDVGTVRPRNTHDRRQADVRHVSVLLCQPSGTSLPETSDEVYPGENIICAVGMQTYKQVRFHEPVCLRPDPDRVDTKTMPRDRWLYAPELRGSDSATEPNTILMCPLNRLRNVEHPQGQVMAYALQGALLHHKKVAHPLSRHAGVAVGSPTGSEMKIGLGKVINVTTKVRVRLGHDFVVAGKSMHITKISATGFVGRQILA